MADETAATVQETADTTASQLAELRAELAALRAERTAQPSIVASPPPGQSWADIPKADGADLAALDPSVAAILAELRAAQAKNAELEALIRSQGAPSRDASAAPDVHLSLACGHNVTESTSVPTDHHCPQCDKTVKVLAASLV